MPFVLHALSVDSLSDRQLSQAWYCHLQAMHAICLAHFERDRAAGGNLYAKFAKCYLQLAGVTPKPKEGDTEVSHHLSQWSHTNNCK